LIAAVVDDHVVRRPIGPRDLTGRQSLPRSAATIARALARIMSM